MGAALSWAPAALGLFCAEVVSARLNPSHGTIDVRRMYVPRFFVSSQQKFGVTDIKATLVGRRIAREREKRALAPLFICFSVPGPVLCKLGQPGVLFVLPEVLTLVLRLSFVQFSRAFPFQVF